MHKHCTKPSGLVYTITHTQLCMRDCSHSDLALTQIQCCCSLSPLFVYIHVTYNTCTHANLQYLQWVVLQSGKQLWETINCLVVCVRLGSWRAAGCSWLGSLTRNWRNYTGSSIWGAEPGTPHTERSKIHIVTKYVVLSAQCAMYMDVCIYKWVNVLV